MLEHEAPARPGSVQVAELDFTRPEQARQLVEILDSYARESVGGGRPLDPSVRERLVPELAAQPNALVLLASTEVGAIGAAVCFFGFSTFAARPLLNIHDLAVLPAFRGRGVGRALLRAAETRARERGCCKLTLEVREDNEPARSLYASAGFSDYAPAAAPTPTLFLEKRLSPGV